MARKVYVLRLNPEYVIKIESGRQSFQNVAEWEYWSWVKDTKIEKWFAPCELISTCGSMLVQRRVTPLRPNELPKRLPAFLDCDLKIENFGLIDGKFVCCDYGTAQFIVQQSPRHYVPAKWRL